MQKSLLAGAVIAALILLAAFLLGVLSYWAIVAAIVGGAIAWFVAFSLMIAGSD